MTPDFDLIVLGGGFGGSLTAMIAQRLGLRAMVLERAKHPRFAIGESTSPLTNLILEQLARRYDLSSLVPMRAYGPWKRELPEVTCGLKRGFTYYHHSAGRVFDPDPHHERQLLVAASPADEVADTHWYRPEVDQHFAREAARLGVEFIEEATVTRLSQSDEARWQVEFDRHGTSFTVTAQLVVDATGPRGALSRFLKIPEVGFDDYPRTQALFSHFTGVKHTAEMGSFSTEGGEPYPPDDAALHHVFAGGWMWVLRFENGITSAGFALEGWLADEMKLDDTAGAWSRLMKRFPTVGEQFAEAEPTLPLIRSRTMPYRATTAAGQGWAMLPSAASFVDPLFSTGFPLTLLGIERLGQILETTLPGDARNAALFQYSRRTLFEVDHTAGFVGACYREFKQFDRFRALSMIYFAAASYSEMARRLGRADLSPGFLGCDRPEMHAASLAKETSTARLCERITIAIEPINVAGLCRAERLNWYPVEMADLKGSAHKLGLNAEAAELFIEQLKAEMLVTTSA